MKTDLYVTNLNCNGLLNPVGIDKKEIQLSWKISGEGQCVVQDYICLQIAHDISFAEESLVLEKRYHTGKPQITIREEIMLAEKKRYYWRIAALLDTGQGSYQTKFSQPAHFVTAYAGPESWKAKWIEADREFYEDADTECRRYWKKQSELGVFFADLPTDGNGLPLFDQGLRRPPYFSRHFVIRKPVSEARISITARGLYELSINGKKIGPCALAPDFTPYDKMIYYQTFEVGGELCIGENELQIIAADGWFCGHAQGIPGGCHLYGVYPAILAQLEIMHTDGSVTEVNSDEQFVCTTGPLLYADLFMGERLDLSQHKKVYPVIERDYEKQSLVPQKGGCIEVTRVLKAVRVQEKEKGVYLVDYGQILAGRELLRLRGKAGTTVKIERSEELLPNGELYDAIPAFPFHDQTNYVTFAEDGEIIYHPQFSFQGFRYLLISGVADSIDAEHCKAEVMGTAMYETGGFKSSSEKLNRLISNVKWSQRGNMLSIPTDCPQRERGGFTGDAQIFASASAWNMDVSQFFKRWFEQCRKEQLPGGQIPIVVPYSAAYSSEEPNPGWTSAGWGDVIIFATWQLYQVYDDPAFLEENYEAMIRWMDYVKRCAAETMPEKYYHDFVNRSRQKYLWNTGFHWGDWLIPGMSNEDGIELTKEIIPSLFYYRAVKVMIQICGELGRWEEQDTFITLRGRIEEAFCMEYVHDGRLNPEVQGNYVIALAVGIVKGDLEKQFADRLDYLVRSNDCCLQTGFLSTPFLLDVLWDHGFKETALRVLYQEKCPSWLYEVNHGATTIWEEWDCINEAGEYKGTSFNHYAFGSVCDFIYRKIGGLTPLENGFHKFQVYPEAYEGIASCEFSYECIYGLIYIKWKLENKIFYYNIEVPHNTTAVVRGLTEVRELGSGRYTIKLH